jgi:membrane protease YdiL (CAAX protease family)
MIIFSGTIQYAYFVRAGTYLQFRDPKIIFAGASTTLYLLYMVAAPIYEETLVRGYLMTELIGLSCPLWLATVASFVVQGAYHLYYGVAGALTASVGFAVLAVYFARSRRLMPIILAHFMWDLSATYVSWHR